MSQDTSTQNEEWRDIPGWEGQYQASNLGRVRSIDRTVKHNDGRVRNIKGKILKPRRSPQDRPLVNLCRDGKCKNVTPHSLVAAAFIGPRGEGEIIRHLDDDPWNNQVNNLAYGNPHHNMWDAIANGLHPDLNKTHCPRGHELIPENTTRASALKGYRDCLACNRARGYIKGRADMSLKIVSDDYYEKIVKEIGANRETKS